MTADELESLLEAQSEARNLDFKVSCTWRVVSFAKDILAFSNLPDGGHIVIGVEDKTFERQGVAAAHKATFDADTMRDQMAAYADPHVNFDVDFPSDRGGREYVVISIRSFDDVPVICKKGGPDTTAGTIYCRNRNRRPESAPVSNSTDMREIVELAAARMARRWRGLGLQTPHGIDQQLDEELGGL